MKKITVPIDDVRDYIELFNGIFDLTDSEIETLTEFVRVRLALDNAGKRKKNAFSTDMKKRVADKLNKENFNSLNTYIKRLKDKRAITPTSDGYKIHRILVPTDDNKIQITLK